jgi:hypothetical protein
MYIKSLLAAALFAALTAAASAADMPVKAPASPFQTYTGSGFYWGVGTTSGVDQSSVTGTTFASSLVTSNLTAAGQSLDAEVGYIWGNASIAGFAQWARVGASGSYQNISAGVSTGGNSAWVASRWQATQFFDVGGDLFQRILTAWNIGNVFPSFTPQLPSNIAVATTPRQYWGVAVSEFGLSGAFGAASGQTVGVAAGPRSGFLWQTVDATGKPNGGALDLGVEILFADKGVAFNNVFATNGAPIAINSSANMVRQYKAYIRYDF